MKFEVKARKIYNKYILRLIIWVTIDKQEGIYGGF